MKAESRSRLFPAISFATFLPAIGFALVILIYWIQQPLILSDFGIVSLCNQSVALALAAMAQTLVVQPVSPRRTWEHRRRPQFQ
jgi:ribose/xylose/arabinose/galactoside ABC-type transport system permease subunit